MSIEPNVVYIATGDNGTSVHRIMFTRTQDFHDTDSEFGGYDRYECYDDEYVRCVYYTLSYCPPLSHTGMLVRIFPEENDTCLDVTLKREVDVDPVQVLNGVLCVYDPDTLMFSPWTEVFGSSLLTGNDLRSLAIFDITVDGSSKVSEFKRMKSTGNIRVVMRGTKEWTLLLDPTGKVLQVGA